MDATDGGPGSSEGLLRQETTGNAVEPKGGGAVEMGANRGPAVRASDRERDAVVQRVQQAFAEGRLDDTEFDERMRAALTARTQADLDVLLADDGPGSVLRRQDAGAQASIMLAPFSP